MTATHRAALLWAVVLAPVGLGLCVLAADPVQPHVAKADPLCPANLEDAQFAVAACASCHNADPTKPADHPFAKRYRSHEFIRLSEGNTWGERDPHQMAFKALEGERGRQMSEALGYEVTKASACLTCHAVDKMAGDTLHPDANATKAEQRFATTEGVACVGCHGVRGAWQAAHYEEPTASGVIPWRGWPTDEKAKRGLRDLRNPVVKANLCASCHVGSAALGRVVTHEMYAAGHPPLPPFELATYLEAEPRHWDRPSELDFFKTVNSEDRWAKYHFHPDEVTAAREFAVGTIAAMRAEAELLAAEAKKGEGIDFARFDCVACHHDLKYPSDRQARGYAGPPGRPPLRASVGILAGVVAEHAGGVKTGGLNATAAGFADKWLALRKAATRQPFGDATVGDKAADVATWCDQFLAVQSECPEPLYPTDQAGRLREAIAAAAVTQAKADPEAAMALAWAYITLGDKLTDEQRAAFEAVLPSSVRTAGAKATDPIGYAERQKAVNAFKTDEFTKAFEKLK